MEVESDAVTCGLLGALGLPILSGRDFKTSDKPGSPNVAIVTQQLAERLFPGGNAVGGTIELSSARSTKLYPLKGTPSYRVIGIVPDVRYYDPHRLTPAVFFAFQKDPPVMPTLFVRVISRDPDGYLRSIRRAFGALEPGLPVFNAKTLETRAQDAVARERMIADLSSVFGLLAFDTCSSRHRSIILDCSGSTDRSPLLWRRPGRSGNPFRSYCCPAANCGYCRFYSFAEGLAN